MKILKSLRALIRELINPEPVPTHSFRHEDYDGSDLTAWITRGIAGYQQWYQHVDFGNGVNAHVTAPPKWEPNPLLNSNSGLDRFEFIIKRNLPNVTGMRILDLGCNVGLFSLALARLGASEVIGVDRDTSIRHRTGRLPFVDLVSQAQFVKKAFEIQENTVFPVSYIAIDFQDLAKLQELGKFDLVLALNVVYHELTGAPELIKALGQMTDLIVLQSSIAHGEPIKGWAAPGKNAEMLMAAGFDRITIDAPPGYLQPVIRGDRHVSNQSS